jgi:O-acetyl-ADP-ribose deacetylase (regulator of RNase III)
VASLAAADALGARSVAFPAISTGVFGYPLHEAAPIALAAVRGASTSVERVRFVLFGREALNAFRLAARDSG